MKEIPLTQGKFALVDDEDYDWLMQWKWFAINSHRIWYVARSMRIGLRKYNKKLRFYMHREVMKTPSNLEVDHINGNGLDNQKNNLRNCTRRENMQNLHTTSSSKFPGVCWISSRCKWKASISKDNIDHHLGYYLNETDAAIAYHKAEMGFCEGF
jgi:hypothetical protein